MVIDRYIKQNIPYQYINSFNMDYTDLAKIFDFDHRSNTILGLKFSNYAMGLIVNLKHADNQYGWDIFTDPAKLYTLKALANGNSVDFSKLDLIQNLISQLAITNTKEIEYLFGHPNRVEKHKAFLTTNSNAAWAIEWVKGQIQLNKLNTDNDRVWRASSGVIANNPELRYTHVDLRNPNMGYYKMANGSIMVLSSEKLVLSSSGDLVRDGLDNIGVDYGRYYYIEHSDGQWAEMFINPRNTGSELRDLFEMGVIHIGKNAVRYALPVEDVLVLITGKDFDGGEIARWKAAGFVFLALIPGSKAFKIVTKVASNANRWKKVVFTVSGISVKIQAKLVGGLVDFGTDNNNRAILKKLLEITKKGIQAHHLIPLALKNLKIVQKAALSEKRFHISELLNGYPLHVTKHLKGHPKYSEKIKQILNILDEKNPNMDNEAAYNHILALTDYIKDLLKNNKDLNLGAIADLINYL